MQRKHLLSALAAGSLVVSSLAASPLPAHAQTRDLGRMSDYIKTAESDTSGKVLKNRWLVQVAGAPVVDGGSASSVASAQADVVKAAASHGVKIKGQRSYSRTFNGMAVTLDAKQVSALTEVPGVTGIYPVVAVSQPVTDTVTTKATADKVRTEMANAVGMTGVAVARDDLGYNGKGIKVGVIDTGIDIDHPDLGGNGTNGSTPFPTKRVKYGYDFVGDAYNSEDPNSIPVPDAVPDDCGGHGTHVAGIIGADGNTATGGIKGVAPKVAFGAYRVFGCEGTTSTDIILAALDRAEADGMDVVNMSLGADMATWPDYPTAQATDAMSRHGIVMVTAAGNSGTDGMFTSGAPSVGHRTISVASYDNVAVTQRSFVVDGTNRAVGYGPAEGSPQPATGDAYPLGTIGAPGSTDAQGCTAYTDAQKAAVAGKAALVQRGSCTFYTKALNAQQAGAKAVVLYNNVPGTMSITVVGDPAITIPVVFVSQDDGVAMNNELATGNAIHFVDGTVSSPSATGGQISDFSSWGVAADLTLKPDLGAPGGNIWSTYPLEKGGHASLSGTSMATPHVAGAVALLLQARPKLKGHPDAVLRLLQNTAVHDAPWRFDTTLGLPEMVVRQGAGMIQVDRAILTQQNVSPGKISLGDDQSNKHTTTLVLRNDARRAVVYTLANQTSIGTLGTTDAEFDLLDANVTMPVKVVVPPRSTKRITVTIKAPTDAPNGYLYGGWLVATSPTATTLNIPYLGMAGDYQRVPVLTAPGFDGPCLAEMVKDAPVCLDTQTGNSYSMAAGDQPVAAFHLEYPTEKALVQVYRANADGTKGALLGTALDLEKDGRELGDLSFAWDGTYQTTGTHSYQAKASAGSYILEVKALRALGKAGVAADWDVWTSAAFTATFTTPAPVTADTAGADVDPTVVRPTNS